MNCACEPFFCASECLGPLQNNHGQVDVQQNAPGQCWAYLSSPSPGRPVRRSCALSVPVRQAAGFNPGPKKAMQQAEKLLCAQPLRVRQEPQDAPLWDI